MNVFSRLFPLAIIVSIGTLAVACFVLADNSSIGISAYIASICGNGTQELTEQCDGSDLNGQTCVGLGYDGGALSCTAGCTFNVSSCTTVSPPAVTGGGGGGGSSYTPSGTNVILQGKAYPNASLTVLKDGRVIVASKAGASADFKITLTTLTAGIYTFGIWAEDGEDRKSITFSFTVTVSSGTTTTVSGIFLPPTINLAARSVKRGENLKFSGQTAPESEINVYIYSEEIVKEATADQNGYWDYSLNTNILSEGSHTTKAKSSLDGLMSSFSQALSFYVGQGSADQESADESAYQSGDLNGDNRINLIDFSVLLYWWGGASESADQNNNGVVDLADFSILLYYWTG